MFVDHVVKPMISTYLSHPFPNLDQGFSENPRPRMPMWWSKPQKPRSKRRSASHPCFHCCHPHWPIGWTPKKILPTDQPNCWDIVDFRFYSLVLMITILWFIITGPLKLWIPRIPKNHRAEGPQIASWEWQVWFKLQHDGGSMGPFLQDGILIGCVCGMFNSSRFYWDGSWFGLWYDIIWYDITWVVVIWADQVGKF